LIAIPIEASVAKISEELAAEMGKKPLADGRLGPLNAEYGATFLIKKLRIKNVVYEIVNTYRTIPRWLRWGIPGGFTLELLQTRVGRDVISVIDEGQAFTGEIVGRFVEPVIRKISVSYFLNYKARFKRIDGLHIDGNQLSAVMVFGWDLSADIQTPLPVGAAKGVLAATGESLVRVRATLGIDDNARLKITFNQGGASPEFVSKLEIPGLDVNLVKLLPLNPSALATKETLAFVIDKLPLHLAAQHFINQKGDKLVFGEKLRDKLAKTARPIALANNIYLDFAPSAVLLGSPFGRQRDGANWLTLPFQIETPIRVIYSSTKLEPFGGTPPAALPIRTTPELRRLVDLQLVGDVELRTATAAADKAIGEIWEKNKYSSKGFVPGPTQLYETTEGRFAVCLPLRKTQGPQKDFVRLFVIGKPELVKENVPATATAPAHLTQSIQFKDLDWTVETKNYLVKTIAWVARDAIRDALAKHTRIPLAGLEKSIRDHYVTTEKIGDFTVSLALKTDEITGFSIYGDYLRVVLHATGEPAMTFK